MGRVSRPVVSEDLWLEAQKLVLELRSKGVRVTASELVDLGLRVILSILKAGYLPDELGYLLNGRDPELAERLEKLQAVRG